jgi:hypothetical protein
MASKATEIGIMILFRQLFEGKNYFSLVSVAARANSVGKSRFTAIWALG